MHRLENFVEHGRNRRARGQFVPVFHRSIIGL
jgi:hypothetical protein